MNFQETVNFFSPTSTLTNETNMNHIVFCNEAKVDIDITNSLNISAQNQDHLRLNFIIAPANNILISAEDIIKEKQTYDKIIEEMLADTDDEVDTLENLENGNDVDENNLLCGECFMFLHLYNNLHPSFQIHSLLILDFRSEIYQL